MFPDYLSLSYDYAQTNHQNVRCDIYGRTLEQTVDYSSISTFDDVKIVICSKLLLNQKFGTTMVVTMDIMMESKKGSTRRKLPGQGLKLLFMMHTKRSFSEKEIYLSC